jgi:indolepyruvate ferredoxin oxidoreductase
VARGLHKHTAYKDEYEVARLLTDPAFAERVAAEVPGGRQLRYPVAPPMLKALGWDHKIALGAWARPALQTLARGKGLRGTRLDPFGRTAIRRLEARAARLLPGAGAAAGRRPDRGHLPDGVAAAEAADLVRGYEDVKLAAVAR